jgi:transportin-1
LLRLANDRDRIVQLDLEKLIPHLDGLINYILLQQHNQEDPELVLDAVEFWLLGSKLNCFPRPLGAYIK